MAKRKVNYTMRKLPDMSLYIILKKGGGNGIYRFSYVKDGVKYGTAADFLVFMEKYAKKADVKEWVGSENVWISSHGNINIKDPDIFEARLREHIPDLQVRRK